MGWDKILHFLKGEYPNYVSAKSIISGTGLTRRQVLRCLTTLRKTDFIDIHISDHKWKHPGRIYRYHHTQEELIKMEE